MTDPFLAELIGLTLAELPPGTTARVSAPAPAHAFDVAAALAGLGHHPPGETPGLAQAPSADVALLAQTLVARLVAQSLPGPGSLLLDQALTFRDAPDVGEAMTAEATVTAAGTSTATLALRVTGREGRLLAEGSATVAPPARRTVQSRGQAPALALIAHPHLQRLLARAAELSPILAAVAWPCDHDSLLGPLEAARRGFLEPILVGDRAMIMGLGADLSGIEIIDAADPPSAAAIAVSLCRDGRAAALMKGSLHTDELMSAAVARDTGLRGPRRLSHVFALDVPAYGKPLYVTDGAVNIAPDLSAKADILQNAIHLAHALGNPCPRVAVLAAVETVNPKMPATLDAALLSKMAERGQITGALVDGPLAFDNAISPAAARTKKIGGPVAGQADILLAPDLESANMIAKQFAYMAAAEAAGIVLGARVPIILTSRADSVMARVASAAIARLLAAHGA